MPHNTVVNNTNKSRVQLQMVHRNDFYNKSNNGNNSLFKNIS